MMVSKDVAVSFNTHMCGILDSDCILQSVHFGILADAFVQIDLQLIHLSKVANKSVLTVLKVIS